MDKALRIKIANRMKALAAMTVENGASETEAAMAFDKLAEMQKEYNFYLDTKNVFQEGIGAAFFRDAKEIVFPATVAISMLTDTKIVVVPQLKALMLFGTNHDCEYAMYLLSIVSNAVEHGWDKFILTPAYDEARKEKGVDYQTVKTSYQSGMVDRLSIRILSLAEKRAPSMTGQEVVVIKTSAAQQLMENMGVESTAVAIHNMVDEGTYNAGIEEGEQVPLNKGIGTKPEYKHLLH